MQKSITKAGVGTVLLIAAAIGITPATSADHEDGHEEFGVGPVKIELTRLEARIPVTVTTVTQVIAFTEKIGEIAAITVTIEDFQGADNTTFTTAGFGFTDACQVARTIPLVRECKVVAGTVQSVRTLDVDVIDNTIHKCIYGLRLSVSVGAFQPLVSTGELLTPADGPCPT